MPFLPISLSSIQVQYRIWELWTTCIYAFILSEREHNSDGNHNIPIAGAASHHAGESEIKNHRHIEKYGNVRAAHWKVTVSEAVFQILAVSLLSIVLAYIWMIGFVARQTYEAILLLSFFWIGFSIGMFLAFAGTVLLILRCPVWLCIYKNRSFTRWFMNLNYLYGILALLILMPLCSTAWEQMQLNLPTFQALLRQQDMLESYVYAFDYQDGYRFDGYDEESVEEITEIKSLFRIKCIRYIWKNTKR